MSDIFEALKQVAPPGSKYAEPKPVDGVKQLAKDIIFAIGEGRISVSEVEKTTSLITDFINARDAGKSSCAGCTRPKVGRDRVCSTCSREWRDNYEPIPTAPKDGE